MYIIDIVTNVRNGQEVSWLETGQHKGKPSYSGERDDISASGYNWQGKLTTIHTGLTIIRWEIRQDQKNFDYHWHIHVPHNFPQAIGIVQPGDYVMPEHRVLYHGHTIKTGRRAKLDMDVPAPCIHSIDIITCPNRENDRSWLEVGGIERTLPLFGEAYFHGEGDLPTTYPALNIIQLPDKNKYQDDEDYSIHWHIDILRGFKKAIARCERGIDYGVRKDVVYQAP